MTDPVDHTTHVFNDLQQRAFALQDFANASCLQGLQRIPVALKELVFPDPLPPIEFEPLLTVE